MTELEGPFTQGLAQLNMSVETESSSLLLTSDLESQNPSINFYQRVSLERAKRIDADAVYFRNSPSSDKSSVAQVYIYDFTKSAKREATDLVELHKNVWSSTDVRIYFIIYKTEIKIFNSAKPIKIGKHGVASITPFDILKITGDAKEKYDLYSGEKFADGSFWDNNSDEFGYGNTAYEKLISELKNARKLFHRDIQLDKKLANKLLVLSILIKYLEERVDIDIDGNETRVFPKNFFEKEEFGYSKDFIEVIKNGAEINNVFLLNVFSFLSAHFSGSIFNILDEYKNRIQNIDLSPLANFLSGEIANNQYVLWKIYSFKHLPVELISSIYEEFLEAKRTEGIAYTPSYLVNLLIDECMPISEPKHDFSILDPACGSGIFLVSAFKRLIDWWRVEEFKKDGIWIKPNKEHLLHLQNMLVGSIYGIDISSEAVDLAIFSLSLTLCDMLSPKVIWEDLKFKDLQKNIICEDFYLWIGKNKDLKFNLIIGNPPFIEYRAREVKINRILSGIDCFVKIPNNQSALLFTVLATHILNSIDGLLCFILPAGPLLYNNTQVSNNFRKHLFTEYNIPQIIDFTYLSNSLFKNKGNEKDVAVAALFIHNQDNPRNQLLHIVAKKLKTIRQRHYFEFDHYDIHSVRTDDAANKTIVWKSNLLGGGRLLSLLERLKGLPTLKDFLEAKKTQGWVYGEGYTKRKPDLEVTREELESGDYQESISISESMTFDVKNFTEKGIAGIRKQDSKFFYRVGNPKQFKAPLLLIKKNIGTSSIPVYLSQINLSYTKEVIGIHSSDEAALIKLHDRILNKEFYRFYILATSARSGISRSTKTILQKDVFNLPFPDNEKEISLSYIDNIVISDTMTYWLDFLAKDKGNKILEPIIYEDLENFCLVFCKVLNNLFYQKEEEMAYQVIFNEIVDNNAIAVFSFKGQADASFRNHKGNLNQYLDKILTSKGRTNISFSKITKFYDGNDIYLIKPLEKKYWLQSVAVRDADEVISDLYNAGY